MFDTVCKNLCNYHRTTRTLYLYIVVITISGLLRLKTKLDKYDSEPKLGAFCLCLYMYHYRKEICFVYTTTGKKYVLNRN